MKGQRENSGEFLRISSVRQYSTSGLSQCVRAGRRLKINNEYQQRRGRCVALHYSKLKIVVRIANKNCGGRFGSVITNIHMAPGGKIGKQTRDRWLLPPPSPALPPSSSPIPLRVPPFFPPRLNPALFSHRVGIVFYRDAANYHCKRPVPVKVERMGFRYDFQKREKAVERQRKRAKSGRGWGEGYKSPWSPIKFMNLDLDRSLVVTILKYFFFGTRYLFGPLPHPRKYRRSDVSGVRPFCSL